MVCYQLANTRDGQSEVEHVAIWRQRKLRDSLGFGLGADLGVGGIQERRVGGDADHFRDAGELQLVVQFGLLTGSQHDRPLNVAAETGLGHAYFIRTRWQLRCVECAFHARDNFASVVGAEIADLDGCRANRCFAVVAYRAQNSASGDLRKMRLQP